MLCCLLALRIVEILEDMEWNVRIIKFDIDATNLIRNRVSSV